MMAALVEQLQKMDVGAQNKEEIKKTWEVLEQEGEDPIQQIMMAVPL